MRYYLVSFLAIAVFVVPWTAANYPGLADEMVATVGRTGSELAAVVLAHDPVTVDALKSGYAAAEAPGGTKIRILIVPGHEPDYGGAEYGSLKERDMTAELGRDLLGLVTNDDHFQAFTTRTATAWTPEFDAYFKDGMKDIAAWRRAHIAETAALAKISGSVAASTPATHVVSHTTARDDVALRLYGVDKWADEHAIDIVIHIHFNDYPGHTGNGPGSYNGFAIYVPEKQYYNSTSTSALAETVYDRLKKYNAVSNLPGEDAGIVQEPDLIAIGPYNTVDAASMLIEYGYIYEPQFQDPAVRSETMKELAYETYLGLLDFFDPNSSAIAAKTYDTLVLPHRWDQPLDPRTASAPDIFALQTALIADGDYPPVGKSLTQCPRSGTFDACTKAALASFQAKYEIDGEDGLVGSTTMSTLNKIYAPDTI